jgi:Secretion system C-terminal sorting domain
MKMRYLLLFIALFVCVLGYSQQSQLFPISINKEQEQRYERERNFEPRPDRGGGGSLSIPFFDDFSRYSLPTNDPGVPVNWQMWEDDNVFLNCTFAKSSPTIGAATFDGLAPNGHPYNFSQPNSYGSADTLTSLPIDLSAFNPIDSVYLVFHIQQGGWGNTPNAGDSLVLEFYTPFGVGEWRQQWSMDGGSAMENFTRIFVAVPEADADLFFVDGFRFRFRNYATLSANADHWNLDYVMLEQNIHPSDLGYDEVSMQYCPNTLLNAQYTSMPWSHFLSDPASFMADSIHFPQRNLGLTQNIATRWRVSLNGADVYNSAQLNNISGNADSEFNASFSMDGFVYADAGNDTSVAFEVCAFFNPTDGHLQNDTVCFEQLLSNYYAYDDGTAEAAYGINTIGGNVAMKFKAQIQDSLIGAYIFWMPFQNDISDNTFFLKVWNESGGLPSDVLQENINFSFPHYYDGYNNFVYYALDNPVAVENNFFIGWVQQNAEYYTIGADMNTGANPTKLYRNFGVGYSWEQESVPGTIMIRPVFKSGLADWTNIYEGSDLNSFTLYPNPATDQLQISLSGPSEYYLVEIFDVTGRTISQERMQINSILNLNIADLPSSSYIIKLTNQSTGEQMHQHFIRQ